MRKSALFEAMLAILLIALLFAMYVMVTTGGSTATEKWAVSGVVANTGNMVYGNVFSCDNGMLYTVDGKNIHALDDNGSVLWSYAIPDKFYIGQENGKWVGLEAAADDKNVLYIILSADGLANVYHKNWQVLAISPDGKLLWNRSSPEYQDYGAPDIKVRGDRLYYFTGEEAYILDMNGNEVKWIKDVYRQPAVDEEGTLYLMPGRVDSYFVESYSRCGDLLWSHGLGEYNVSGTLDVPDVDQPIYDPIYDNGTLYLWLRHDALALNMDGSLKWKKSFGDAYMDRTWLDPDGDAYVLLTVNGPSAYAASLGAYVPPSLLVIHPDGSDKTLEGVANFDKLQNAREISGGVAYVVDMVRPPDTLDGYESHEGVVEDLERYYLNDSATTGLGLPKLYKLPNDRNIVDLDTYNVSAYDVRTGELLWSYAIPLSPQRIVLNASNAGKVLFYTYGLSDDNNGTPADWYRSRGIPEGVKAIDSYSWIELAPSKDLLYLNFWSYNFEVPTFYDRAKCVYSGGIYALDKNGRLAWDQSTGSRVTYMEEKNGTVYYSTGDGRISAASVDLAAGAALLAAVYLFIRFFLVGAVSRARDRLDKNGNRNKVLEFVTRNPGATTYDVSRGLHMNLGTARYHLMILGINHRLVAHKTDLKYVRYFLNSGSYSGNEQLAMSLVRREGMKKILGLLIEKPGLSHTQLSRALDMPEGSLSRYMKELSEKGIVDREATANGTGAYFVKSEHRQAIASMMRRL